MKKLMIAVAAIALAYGVNAAQVAWTATSLSASPTGITPEVTTYSAYLFLTASDVGTDTTVKFDDVSRALAAGGDSLTTILESAVASGTKTASSKGAISFSSLPKYGSYSQGQGVTAFMVILDAATPEDAGYFLVADKEGVAAISGTAGSSGNISLAWGSQSGNTAWTAVAPEPTSGLLLLLGVAGLALRRRRA